jgi:hypothetical protein
LATATDHGREDALLQLHLTASALTDLKVTLGLNTMLLFLVVLKLYGVL